MTMHERIMSGKLFTDMCEGMPEERLAAKQRMKRLNDCPPENIEARVKLLAEFLASPVTPGLSRLFISAMAGTSPLARAPTSM